MSLTFPIPTADTYRGPAWSTEELKTWLEYYRLERAAAIAHATDRTPGTVAYCEYKMDAILTELERRKALARRFRNDPRGPRWSTAAGRTDLVELAQDLKHLWPIDRFLTDLMLVDLRPNGPNRWQCRCITGLHADRNPSMTVYGDGDPHVFCHACRYGGDVIDLTCLHFGLTSFAEAVRKIAEATSPSGEDAHER